MNLAIAGWLTLAGSGGVRCTVPHAPHIRVTPVTAPVSYDYSLSSEELGRFKNDTVNPYAPGTDTTTGGLRSDRPKVTTEVKWSTRLYPDRDLACLWYETVSVKIELSPKIYIASDRKGKACRAAILAHEKKHVAVDHTVINAYAADIGRAVKEAVDQVGAAGPYNAAEREAVQQRLVEHVRAAVASRELPLYQEMARAQAKVDSLEEYERISAICTAEERHGRR